MKAAGRWCLWKKEERDGKTTKAPYSARVKGFKASSTNPATWATYEEATAALETGEYSGLGFMLGKEGDKTFVGLDIDHCRNPETGEFDDGVIEIVHSFGTYAEISPSGTGIHAIGYGEKPAGSRCRKGPVEIYESGRFFTVTGDHIDGTPGTVEDIPLDALAAVCEMVTASPPQAEGVAPKPRGRSQSRLTDDEVISLLCTDRSREALFNGDKSAYDNDDSRADLAICDHLAYWTNGDAFQMDRIFRRSGLMRPKWTEKRGKQTYGEMTIAEAIRSTPNGYEPPDYETGEAAATAFLQAAAEEEAAPAANEWPDPVSFEDHELKAFPTNALPDWMRDYVQELSEELQVPEGVVAMFLLAACASAIARKIEVSPWAGWVEPTNIYTAIVQEPGARKSVVSGRILKPILAYEKELAIAVTPKRNQAIGDKELLKKRIAKLEADAAKADRAGMGTIQEEIHALRAEMDAIEVPVIPRLVADDVTPEKLSNLIVEQDGRMAILSGEGGGIFDIASGRYSGGVPNLDVFLKAHAGDPIIVDRVSRGYEQVDNPALTIGVTIQPKVIRDLSEQFDDDGRGFLARFLFMAPPSMVGRRKVRTDPINAWTEQAYFTVISTLLEMGIGNVTAVIKYTEEAAAVMEDFAAWVEPRIPTDNAQQGWNGKFTGAVVRLSGIIHMCADPQGGKSTLITVDEVERAITIGKSLFTHAVGVFGEMLTGPARADAEYLIGVLTAINKSTVKRAEIWQRAKKRFGTADKLNTALEVLADRGYIREPAPQRRADGRGNSAAMYAVHPSLISSTGGRRR